MAKMKSRTFVSKLIDVAKNYKTLYVMGCFGAPMNSKNKTRYINNGASNGYNAQSTRKAMINRATDDTFGFDCVCLIKGILWGWCGDKSKVYGGSGYTVNGVPDIGADSMITKCLNVSTTGWANMVPGEAVWMSGHIGVYIGDGLAVECTPKWANKVQITAVGNIGAKSGYNTRKWTKHGKLPYVDYSDQTSNTKPTTPAQPTTGLTPQDTKADEKATFDALMKEIGNIFGVCGLMGNLFHESGLIPNNAQNTGNAKLGMTDVEYTNAVDNGTYTQFTDKNEGIGYGLAQWTYYTRKAALLAFAKAQKASIGNRDMQHKFLVKELKESFSAVWKVLTTATSVQQASDAVLLNFERPANANSHKAKRAAKGMEYYNKYAGSTTLKPPTPSGTVTEKKATQVAYKRDDALAGTYTVTAPAGLHVRTKAGGVTPDTSMVVLPKGTKVQNWGYYNLVGATKWLYIQVTYNGVKYTGYCSKDWLQK